MSLAPFALLAWCFVAPSTGPQAGDAIRVGVLSLVSPRRVTIAAPARLALLSGTVDTAAGSAIEAQAGRLRVRASDGRSWLVARASAGAPGARLDVVVEGRETIARSFRGVLRVEADGDRLRLVVDVALEDLVASSVAAELAADTSPAALEAAAIAVRSYVAGNVGRHAREGFDVCDTTHCLFSQGVPEGTTPVARAAVAATAATRGLGLVREGHVVAGFYTAVCGGSTTTPARVWGGDDTGDYARVTCRFCERSPFHRWRRTVPAADLHAAIADLCGWRPAIGASLHADHAAGGWVRRVTVRSGEREARPSGDAFRLAVGRRLGWDTLPSSRFSLERRSGAYDVRGRGFGHGVGLCLVGAAAQAERGASAYDILRFYYPRASVGPLP